jgi:hypothetical protein
MPNRFLGSNPVEYNNHIKKVPIIHKNCKDPAIKNIIEDLFLFLKNKYTLTSNIKRLLGIKR